MSKRPKRWHLESSQAAQNMDSNVELTTARGNTTKTNVLGNIRGYGKNCNQEAVNKDHQQESRQPFTTKNGPLNYRRISLPLVISKILTGLLAGRIVSCLKANNLLPNAQNGFRSERSCLDQIFTLCDLVRIRNGLNNETFCAIVDFQKAFDFVNHEFLLHKLAEISTEGHIYNVVKSIYTNSLSCVAVNDWWANWFSVQSRVRQGDLLFPSCLPSLLMTWLWRCPIVD